jgi:hypothetical protein
VFFALISCRIRFGNVAGVGHEKEENANRIQSQDATVYCQSFRPCYMRDWREWENEAIGGDDSDCEIFNGSTTASRLY